MSRKDYQKVVRKKNASLKIPRVPDPYDSYIVVLLLLGVWGA